MASPGLPGSHEVNHSYTEAKNMSYPEDRVPQKMIILQKKYPNGQQTYKVFLNSVKLKEIHIQAVFPP